MTGNNEREQVIQEIQTRLRAFERSAALQARVEEIHIAYHDHARMHMRVHAWRMRMAWREHRFGRVIIEALAIPFVAPTSFVQRYLGLALPSRMRPMKAPPL